MTIVKARGARVFATLADNCDGIVGPAAHAATDLCQVGEDAVEVGVHGRELGGEQLVGKRVRLHAATPCLSLKALVGIGGEVDYPVARCHQRKV